MSEDDKPRGEPAVKAKLPKAQNIKRPDFTPHGIAAGRGRAPRPSALTAAKAKQRQRVMVAGLLVAVLAIAGGTTWMLTRPGPQITVSGEFSKEPKVEIPEDLPAPTKLKVTELTTGKGAKVASGDSSFVKFVFYKVSPAGESASPSADPEAAAEGEEKKTDGKLGSTYTQAESIVPMVVGQSGIKGVDQGLVGHPVGSRLLMEIPPSLGLGDNGAQLGVAKNDALVFVMDVLATVPKGATASGTEQKLDDKDLPTVKAGKAGAAPKVTIPKTDAPGKLEAKTLIDGTGPVVAKGQTIVAHYEGKIWRNGKVFDSSWQRGAPATFEVGTGKVVSGWDKGLVGKKVGSRVLLVVPPKEGYGKKGQPDAGIKGTDTLVFVVEILAAIPK